MSNPHLAQPDPDALVPPEYSHIWADGYAAGWEDAPRPAPRRRPGLIVGLILGIVIGLLTGFRLASAAPRSAAQPVIPAVWETVTSGNLVAQPSGAPRSGMPVEAAAKASREAPAQAGGVGAPLSHGRSGVIAYATIGGPGYLAIPIGPGHLVTICGPAACWTTVSTDAGPNHERLVAGRIADVAVGQWERLCGMPRTRGTCRGSWVVVGPAPTPPATDVSP